MIGKYKLLTTTLFGAMVLVSNIANASVVTHDFSNGDSLANWSVDRAAPSSFSIINNELVMAIDGNDYPDSRAPFYDTQGMQLDIGKSTYLSIDMYVDSSWSSSERFAGMWGVGRDSSDDISAYPILEYQGPGIDGPSAGFNIWDNSGWQGITTLFDFDAFNTLELLVTGAGIEYYLNDSLVHTDASSGTTYLSAVILNAKNDGTSFDVRYDNLKYGNVPEPTVITLFGAGLLAAGFVRRRRQRA